MKTLLCVILTMMPIISYADEPVIGTIVIKRDGVGLITDVFKLPGRVQQGLSFIPTGNFIQFDSTWEECHCNIHVVLEGDVKVLTLYGADPDHTIWNKWVEYHRDTDSLTGAYEDVWNAAHPKTESPQVTVPPVAKPAEKPTENGDFTFFKKD